MTTVNLNKNFSERNGKYYVRYNIYNDINMYIVSSEYYNVNYKEDLKVSVTMNTEAGVVSDLDVHVEVINVERISKRRELIAFEVKQSVVKYIEQLKSRHNNVLGIDFIKDVVSFILNYNVCNRYEVVVEEDAIELNEDAIELNKVNKVSFNKSFEVNRDGLLKSYSIKTEEVESQYGYTDLLCKMEATSTVLVDDKYVSIKANIEVCDGVVISYHVYQSRIHKQIESFLDSMTIKNISKAINELVEDIKYEANSYIGEKGYDFAYSLLRMVLSLNSYDSNTCLYNEETYSLVDVA